MSVVVAMDRKKLVALFVLGSVAVISLLSTQEAASPSALFSHNRKRFTKYTSSQENYCDGHPDGTPDCLLCPESRDCTCNSDGTEQRVDNSENGCTADVTYDFIGTIKTYSECDGDDGPSDYCDYETAIWETDGDFEGYCRKYSCEPVDDYCLEKVDLEATIFGATDTPTYWWNCTSRTCESCSGAWETNDVVDFTARPGSSDSCEIRGNCVYATTDDCSKITDQASYDYWCPEQAYVEGTSCTEETLTMCNFHTDGVSGGICTGDDTDPCECHPGYSIDTSVANKPTSGACTTPYEFCTYCTITAEEQNALQNGVTAVVDDDGSATSNAISGVADVFGTSEEVIVGVSILGMMLVTWCVYYAVCQKSSGLDSDDLDSDDDMDSDEEAEFRRRRKEARRARKEAGHKHKKKHSSGGGKHKHKHKKKHKSHSRA